MFHTIIFISECFYFYIQQQMEASHSPTKLNKIINNTTTNLAISATIDQIQSLSRSIQQLCEKNRQKHQKIIKTNPYFTIKLYNPPVCLNTKKDQINFTRTLLMRQIQILMEEQNKLNRQLHKLQLKEQEQIFTKQCKLQKEINHYLFLRNVWKRNVCALDADDKIEKLNKSVALIKSHIQNEIKRQQSNDHQMMLKHDCIIQSRQYCQLKEKYETLLMERQQFFANSSRVTLPNGKNSQNQQIQRLKKQNTSLLNQLNETKQYKQKIRNLEKTLVKNKIKIQQLEEQIYSKERQINKINRDIKFIYRHKTQDQDNDHYQIQIISKDISGKKEIDISIPLTKIIEFLENQKQQYIYSTPQQNRFNVSDNKLPVMGDNNQCNKLFTEKPVRFGHINKEHSQPQRRFRSIANTGQQELKKTRFIRTKNIDQNKDTKPSSILKQAVSDFKFDQ